MINWVISALKMISYRHPNLRITQSQQKCGNVEWGPDFTCRRNYTMSIWKRYDYWVTLRGKNPTYYENQSTFTYYHFRVCDSGGGVFIGFLHNFSHTHYVYTGSHYYWQWRLHSMHSDKDYLEIPGLWTQYQVQRVVTEPRTTKNANR